MKSVRITTSAIKIKCSTVSHYLSALHIAKVESICHSVIMEQGIKHQFSIWKQGQKKTDTNC